MTAESSRKALLAEFRTRLQEGQRLLREAYFADAIAPAMLTGRCALIDGLLRDLWQSQAFPQDMALVAVGGYGRGELYPASDVDLLILLSAAPDEQLQAKLEALVGMFWDIGLEIGHSVRTLEECLSEAAGDITIQTALIEARQLTGDDALFERFQDGLQSTLNPQAFFKAKRIEQDERYLRFQDTPFSLEPNLKESPGGLRDLQVILWSAQAAGFGRNWA
ncbi:MAG: [protein-PII] uridylyltransferase, partial [Pseudomonadota bacterium]|nr:[protein-PII] uridylyltransferase [Pseudomonadota bacterium]